MIFNHLTRLVLAAALVLVVSKGLASKCWSFVAYLSAVLVGGALMAYWPGSFYAPPYHFWLFTRDLYAGAKVLVALELGLYVFRAFPRAARVSRWAAVWILGAFALALPSLPFVGGFQAWTTSRGPINAATVWLFASLALLVVYFNLPLDRWHRSIIVGFTVQLLVGSLLLASESVFRKYGVILDPVIATWWVYSAWAPGVRSAREPGRQLVGRGAQETGW